MNVSWDNFHIFASVALILWTFGAFYALFSEKQRISIGLTLAGTVIFALFITGFWIALQRPPLRTMGETRLWYSFFMSIAGLHIFDGNTDVFCFFLHRYQQYSFS